MIQMKQCKTCGYSAPEEEIFRNQKNIWGRVHTYCQVCADNLASRTFKQKMFFSFCSAFAVSLYFLYDFFKSIWLPLSFVLVPAFITAAVIFHEIGHALVARIIGLKVHFVIIGSGKPWFKFKLGKTEIDIRSQPFSGFTGPAFTSIKGARYKRFLISGAGPFMNLVLAILPFFLAIKEFIWWISFWNPYLPLQMFILVNLYSFIMAMWPRTHNTPLGRMPNDGKSLLMIPTMSQSTIEGWLTVNFSLEAKKLREAEDFQAAERVVREGLAKFPDNPTNLNDLALIYLETSQYHEALTILHALMKRVDAEPSMIHIFANNIAWTNLLTGDPELLDEADRLSEEAYRFHPRMPSIMNTRGWVLITRGRVEDGIFLLQSGFDRTHDLQAKAVVACCLAMGEAKLGHFERAKLYLYLAKKMDSSCVLFNNLSRLAPELAEVL
ncbi:MAG TPA: site-2 protease family protein [Bacillota bacterium]|nr:site-2 protease family protein [Bacillota bacterium]